MLVKERRTARPAWRGGRLRRTHRTGARRAPGVRRVQVDTSRAAGRDGGVDVGRQRHGNGIPAIGWLRPAMALTLLIDPLGVIGLLHHCPAVLTERLVLLRGGTGAGCRRVASGVHPAPGSKLASRDLRTLTVETDSETTAFLRPQVADVRRQQHRGKCGSPQEPKTSHGRQDTATGEPEEQDHRRTPPPRQHPRALGALVSLATASPPGLRSPGMAELNWGLKRRTSFRSVVLAWSGLIRWLPGAVLLAVEGVAAVGQARMALHLGYGIGEGPDVGYLVRAVHFVRAARPVRLSCVVIVRGRIGSLLPLLGVAPLHRRPAGQQPDGGAEAFRGASVIQLILATEPHGHQIGGPSPDDDCVDEAAVAHASHGRGVLGKGSAD